MTQTSSRPKTEAIFNQLNEVIPGGVNSPIRSCKSVDCLPLVVEKGEGALIYDADGNCYIDYCGSWGPLIHGHAHPAIINAAYTRMLKGTSFGITTQIEEKLARKVIEILPHIEKIRFVSSGTEACMTAARLARGYTKRPTIVKFSGHYHGHADFFLVQAGSGLFGLTSQSSSSGIPQEIIQHTVCLPFNDSETVRNYLTDPQNAPNIACVILEPIAANMGVVPSTHKFMQMLRDVTQDIGALLIFDEVITGFRIGLKGAQEYYQVTPDLSCFGKIIGAGFPVAAFGGKREIMDQLAPLGTVYQAGTLSGNPVAMEAGLQSLTMLQEPGFYEGLRKKTEIITIPVKEAIQRGNLNACIQDAASLFTLFFGRKSVHSMEDAKTLDTAKFAKFFKYMLDHGVYIPPLQYEAWFVSSAHEENQLVKTRDLILESVFKM